MSSCCGLNCTKVSLIIYNTLISLFGLAFITLGAIFRLDQTQQNFIATFDLSQEPNYLRHITWGFIGLGVFVVLVGLIGIWAAVKLNRYLLVFYMVLVLLASSGELLGGVVAVVHKGRLEATLKSDLTRSARFYYYSPLNSTETSIWNSTQLFLECCAGESAFDYKASQYSHEDIAERFPLPKYCCKLMDGVDLSKVDLTSVSNSDFKNLTTCATNSLAYIQAKWPDHNVASYPAVNVNGCFDKMIDWLRKGVLIFIIIGCFSAPIQMFGLIFAGCLICRLSGGKKV